MTAVVPEFELIELEDLEFAIPCCVSKPYGCGGDNAAVWIAYGAHCCSAPNICFYCTPCKDMMTTFPGGVLCASCGHLFQPASTAFRLIEPLNP